MRELSGNFSGRPIFLHTEMSKVPHFGLVIFVVFTKTEPVAVGKCLKLNM